MTGVVPGGPTRIQVRRDGGRLRTSLRSGLLRPQQVRGAADRCRIGLLATTALLLGGDQVELEVEVGEGVTLELFDVAGTVAYDGRGAAAGWRVAGTVAAGGRLRWSGEPFVVTDGARVRRDLELDLAVDAELLLRETLVLGRAGQRGGAVRSRTTVRRGDRPVLVEDLDLDPAGPRTLPGMLGPHRVLDTVLAVGGPPGPVLGPTPPGARIDELGIFRLADGAGTVLRHLGPDLAASPLHRLWAGRRVDQRAG